MPAIQFVLKNYKETPSVETMNTEAMQKSNGSKNVTAPVATGKRLAFDHSYIDNVLSKNRSTERLETDEIGEYEGCLENGLSFNRLHNPPEGHSSCAPRKKNASYRLTFREPQTPSSSDRSLLETKVKNHPSFFPLLSHDLQGHCN
ncbi:hypothetical protein OUZ56_011811 [Daphnia magna]|uniref:Uncharacterized protein n=1 Tax=Daphnia magna TaxID=35525 RepID=A0ABQ9Z1A1_9CRUS|nr:hypothetical protein OUZ56_011811 [Daphnia magna]